MATNEEATKSAPYVPGPNAVDITPEKDGGILKEIIKEGEGDALPGIGCNVVTHYHGSLTDGTVFDSSKESGKHFQFTLGKGSVIKAWDLGVATMKKGEIAMFTCKSEYAYGKRGSPPKIPADATLIFEITLFDWEAEDISKDKDGGILRTTIENGDGYASPNDGAIVDVHITGRYDNVVFEDRDINFHLGEGVEFGVIEGVERALAKFRKGEKSKLEIKSKYAFKEEGNKEFNIPPNATVEYTVLLKNFEKAKDTWDMDSAEKLSQAQLLKEKATNYFKAGKLPLALKLYTKLIDYVDSDSGFDENEDTERKALLLAVRLNLGLVHLKLKQSYEAKNECDKALEIDPKNVKGLFRRGQAYLDIEEPEKAKLDFEAVVQIEPSNKLAANQVIICQSKIKEQRQKEKKIYSNMFEKFAQKDKEDGITRFGWWDDEQKKPVVTEMEPVDTESLEEIKEEKKKQLEHFKKVAQAKREAMEKLRKEKLGEDAESEEKEAIREDSKDFMKIEETENQSAENSPKEAESGQKVENLDQQTDK